jgi:hypothetical protein
MGLLNFSKFIQKGYRGNATKLKEMVQEIEDLQHKEFCSGKDYYHREYDLKTAEEKVKFVKECKQKVYDIILFISEDETPFQRRFNQLIDCLYSSGE